MKFHHALVIAVAGAALILSGCAGGGMDEAELEPLPPVEIPTLTPEPQPFRTQTSFADGVLSIDVPTPGGPTRTLACILHRGGCTWGNSGGIGKGVKTLPKTPRSPHATRVYAAAAVF